MFYMLLCLISVDYLLPSVKVPMFAWILLGLLFLAGKVVKESWIRGRPVEARQIHAEPVITWTESPDYKNVFNASEEPWHLINSAGTWALWQDEESSLILTATRSGEAFDQAEKIIKAVNFSK